MRYLFKRRNEHRAASKQLPRNAPPWKELAGGEVEAAVPYDKLPPRHEALRDLNLLGAMVQ